MHVHKRSRNTVSTLNCIPFTALHKPGSNFLELWGTQSITNSLKSEDHQTVTKKKLKKH